MEVSSSSLCDLSEDVAVEEILSRLPIEQLINCRYVSKLWKNGLIPRVLLSQQKTKPTFGLIAKHSTMETTNGTPVKLSLLRRIEEDEQRSGGRRGEYIEAIPNLFSLCLKESEVLSSCNGLLLCWIREAKPPVKPRTIYYYFYVCNPVLNQWVAIPQPNYSLSRSPNIGFAFYDTTIDDHQGHHQAAAQKHHYKVVHFYVEKTYLLETKMIPCEIFSSETGEWRQHQARLLSTSSIFSDIAFRILETDDRFWCNGSPHLYHKGVIYWKFDWYNYLLLFLLEDEVFKLIPLPDDPKDGFVCHGRFGTSLLWESKGCIYYLWATTWKLHVWAYLGSSTKEDEEWVLKHLVERQTLKSQMPPENCILLLDMVSRLHTFDADLQVLYLPMKGKIFSYNFETKKPTALRTYKYENNAGGDLVPLTGLSKVIPYRFTLFDLPTWDGCKVLRPKLSADKTCLLTRSLFNLQT